MAAREVAKCANFSRAAPVDGRLVLNILMDVETCRRRRFEAPFVEDKTFATVAGLDRAFRKEYGGLHCSNALNVPDSEAGRLRCLLLTTGRDHRHLSFHIRVLVESRLLNVSSAMIPLLSIPDLCRIMLGHCQRPKAGIRALIGDAHALCDLYNASAAKYGTVEYDYTSFVPLYRALGFSDAGVAPMVERIGVETMKLWTPHGIFAMVVRESDAPVLLRAMDASRSPTRAFIQYLLRSIPSIDLDLCVDAMKSASTQLFVLYSLVRRTISKDTLRSRPFLTDAFKSGAVMAGILRTPVQTFWELENLGFHRTAKLLDAARLVGLMVPRQWWADNRERVRQCIDSCKRDHPACDAVIVMMFRTFGKMALADVVDYFGPTAFFVLGLNQSRALVDRAPTLDDMSRLCTPPVFADFMTTWGPFSMDQIARNVLPRRALFPAKLLRHVDCQSVVDLRTTVQMTRAEWFALPSDWLAYLWAGFVNEYGHVPARLSVRTIAVNTRCNFGLALPRYNVVRHISVLTPEEIVEICELVGTRAAGMILWHLMVEYGPKMDVIKAQYSGYLRKVFGRDRRIIAREIVEFVSN